MISIIVPVYNAQKYITKCLESIVTQNFKDIEIIIVNDGSTDNSLKIINFFAKRDSRIKVINKQNDGRAIARNIGLKNSSGEFIMFVDADDELEQGAIKKLYDAIVKDNSDIVVGNVSIIYEAHNELKNGDAWFFALRYKGTLNINDDLIWDLHNSTWGRIFKRSIIEKYKLQFPEKLNYEDAYWHWVYLTSCNKISFINDIVYKYFRRKESIMSLTFEHKEGLAIQHLYIVDKLFDFWNENKTLISRFNTVLNLLERYFWFSFKNSPNYEKIKSVCECVRIVKKYNLPIENNTTINKIYSGKLCFLFPDYNDDNIISYTHYIQIMSLINKIFPNGSARRKYLYFCMRYCYRLIKKIKH